MKDVSIEYAHIYTNSKISEEHELSLKELEGVRGQNSSLVVMVDDYSFPDPTFDYGAFTSWLSDQGHAPNVVVRESQLIPQCDEVLALLEDEKLKGDIVDYIKAKKYPCSLFIAVWYLVRLGRLSHPQFPEAEQAEKLINILPESFKPFEEKGFDIIRGTRHRGVLNSIENRYLAGRLIA